MLPIALRSNGRFAVIVGGGTVALRKAEALSAAGLRLRIVALRIESALRDLIERTGGELLERAYEPRDIERMTLAIAATNDAAINARVIADAQANGILASDATSPERGDFSMMATVRIGDLTFTVDSGGGTPAFSKRIAREIQAYFGVGYDGAARTLARMRTYVKAVVPESQRSAVLRELAELPIEELASMNPIVAEHVVESTIERLQRDGEPAQTSSVICASRASALAMTQSKMVAARLAERGIASTILNVTTTGDRVQDRPLAELGGTSVFVKELELALRERRADYAVHSCKDLPSELAEDMQIAAISRREDPRDAFCSERFASFEDLPSGAVVGTSSPRRRWLLEALRPDLQYKDIRGNVDTRLRKLRDGDYDAIVLAMAGLIRLRARATHTVPFEIEVLVPAVAQGALAIETRADDELAVRLRDAINDEESERCVRCERAALRVLHAGCDAPVGIHARLDGTQVVVEAAYALPAGPVLRIQARERAATVGEAEAAGKCVGEQLLAKLRGYVDPLPPLHGRLVVLPRTQERPSRIAATLRERGAEVIELTAGDPGPDPARQLPDMLVFPSSGSVAAAAAYLQTLRGAARRPRIAAMGPLSAQAAREAGFAPDAVASEPSIEAFANLISESLLL